MYTQPLVVTVHCAVSLFVINTDVIPLPCLDQSGSVETIHSTPQNGGILTGSLMQ